MAADDSDFDGARHPRHTTALVGHDAAENHLLRGYASGRLPHGILIAGPRGIGKATLAYRFARFLLDEQGRAGGGLLGDDEPANLDIPSDSRTARLVAQDGHPGLKAVERGWDDKNKRFRADILVDDVRKLHGFFGMTSTDGGWRVAIIDAADEMNLQAANAVLKVLEEPPKRSVILMVSHAPGQLLPTLRSRCQRLTLQPLSPDDLAAVLAAQGIDVPAKDAPIIAALSAGSPGRALELVEGGGAGLYRDVMSLMQALPRLDARAMHGLGDRVSGKGGTDLFRLLATVLDGVLQRLIAFKATNGAEPLAVTEEGALFARLAPLANLEQWIEVWENTGRLFRRAEAVNLDPKQVTLTTLTQLERLTAT